MSLLNSVNKGVTSWAIFCISSLVSAEFKLKKIDDNLSNAFPENSKASIVFKKVGLSGLFIMVSISVFAAIIFSIKAGLYSSIFICENGAVSYFVLNFCVSVFILFCHEDSKARS